MKEKYCKNCNENPIINCGCSKLYSSNCVIYEGVDFEEYSIYKGIPLTSMLDKLFSIISDINDKNYISGAINLGNGVKILKNLNSDNILEFKTLSESNSVNITESTESIELSVNETWIEQKIENVSPRNDINSIGNGVEILQKEGSINNIRSLKSDNDNIEVSIDSDTIKLKSKLIENIGIGVPIYGGSNKIKSISSETLFIGDNNGTIEINTSPKYNWIAYANDIFGKDISLSSLNEDGTTKSYIGFAYNKVTELPSLNYLDYTWVKLKGNDGHTGYVLDISNDNIVIPTDSEGKLGSTSLEYAVSELRLYYGNSIVFRGEYDMVIEKTNGLNYTIDKINPESDKIKITEINFPENTGSLNISIYNDTTHSELLAKGTINVIKLVGLDAYEIITSVKTIKVTQESDTENEIIEPNQIITKVIKNTGFEIKEITEGVLTYKYSYQLPMEKGTQITPGTPLIISNTNNPIYLEFNYYSPKNPGIVIDRETVPFVRDGKNGSDGDSIYTLDLSNEAHMIPTNSEGKTVSSTAYIGSDTLITLYKGNDIIPVSEWDIEIIQSGGIVYTLSDLDLQNRQLVISDINLMSDVGYLDIKAKQSGTSKLIGNSRFSITKAKGTFSLKLQPSVNQVVMNYKSDGTYEINPTSISIKLIKNDGNYVSEVTNYDVSYKYNDSPVENTIRAGGIINLSYVDSRTNLEFKIYDKLNTSIILDKETIPFVKSGIPGVPGSRGPAIRQLEWREGYTYVNNNEFRDYIYYRSSNPTFEGWYVTKGVSAVANSGYPDLSLFEKQPFTESSIFGNIIAENANLAGFIFRNQQLFSQAGMEQISNPTYSNMLINGLTGFLKFSQKLYIDKDGITFFDANKNPRIRFGFEDTEKGTPYLRFLAEDGTILWEAGKDYTKWITQGTTQPQWGSKHAYANIYLSDDKDTKPSLANVKTAVDNMITNQDGTTNKLRILSSSDSAVWKNTSMPSDTKTINKGDMASNQDLYDGWYNGDAPTMLRNHQIEAGTTAGLIPDGWYVGSFESGYGGVPGYELYGGMINGVLEFKVYIFYILKGKIYTKHDYVVHEKTENI